MGDVQGSGKGPLDNPRETREFLQAKIRAGAPVEVAIHAEVWADVRVQGIRHFAQVRALLRESPAYSGASSMLDVLEASFRKRAAHAMPPPDLLRQRKDSLLQLQWGEALTMLFRQDRCTYCITVTQEARRANVIRRKHVDHVTATAELFAFLQHISRQVPAVNQW